MPLLLERAPLMRASILVLASASLLSAACVSGNKIRAEADVLKNDIERAERNGAMRCAPVELATAKANLEFAEGELNEGSSFRAAEHIREADAATKKALHASRDCAPKQVLVREDKPVVLTIEETDSDGDGVFDKDDKCAKEAEDRDGFEDEDGCPDPDNDKDGVLDTNDKCALLPGPSANQGCPEDAPKDRDNDGIPDPLDRCLDQPEDKDNFQDEDGCPEPDNDNDGLLDTSDKCPSEAGPIQNLGCPVVDKDGDGINDKEDKCPDEPEDKDGFQDTDGCPDLDNDGDGISDAQDECRDEPGVQEEKGCPRKYKMVVVKKDRIEIKQQIKFKTGSAKIVGGDSFLIISDIAQALRDSPQIKKVRIEGHTDSVGNDATNLRLSQKRADAVLSALLKERVDPGRMEAVGFGETKPISSNATATGRQENRRTEFNIVEQ